MLGFERTRWQEVKKGLRINEKNGITEIHYDDFCEPGGGVISKGGWIPCSTKNFIERLKLDLAEQYHTVLVGALKTLEKFDKLTEEDREWVNAMSITVYPKYLLYPDELDPKAWMIVFQGGRLPGTMRKLHPSPSSIKTEEEKA